MSVLLFLARSVPLMKLFFEKTEVANGRSVLSVMITIKNKDNLDYCRVSIRVPLLPVAGGRQKSVTYRPREAMPSWIQMTLPCTPLSNTKPFWAATSAVITTAAIHTGASSRMIMKATATVKKRKNCEPP